VCLGGRVKDLPAYRRLAEYAGGDARSAIRGHAAKLRKPT
jgi:hypothetical protein